MSEKQPPTQKQKRQDKQLHQRAFLAAYRANLFNVSAACKAVPTDRSNYYRWLKEDPEFARQVREIQEEKLDFIEGKLMQKISDGHIIAIIFALKCLGKDRGYVEEQRITFKPIIDTISKEHRDSVINAALQTISSSRKLLPQNPKTISPEDTIDLLPVPSEGEDSYE